MYYMYIRDVSSEEAKEAVPPQNTEYEKYSSIWIVLLYKNKTTQILQNTTLKSV